MRERMQVFFRFILTSVKKPSVTAIGKKKPKIFKINYLCALLIEYRGYEVLEVGLLYFFTSRECE